MPHNFCRYVIVVSNGYGLGKAQTSHANACVDENRLSLFSIEIAKLMVLLM
ncbi:MAG: hypothetical protein LBR54_04225 [Oscillospiraceae bacterium]|nr:hypothetical protein [Oscillospiraceae bacterium]